MKSVTSGIVEFLTEQMAGLGPVTSRRMFGGTGLYKDGLMFALVADDTLYLKVGETTRADFEAEALAPFSYATKDGSRTLTSYWRAPDRCLDDPDEMALWCGKALTAARRPGKPGRGGGP